MQPEPRPPRLQKVLAHAGVGSRQACERLIADGRVMVDGQVVTDLGRRVDPHTAVIEVDGNRLEPRVGQPVHLAVHKPPGVVAAMRDSHGRPCLSDLPGVRQHPGLFHVGRLDADCAGVLLLTDDGDLAHRLTDGSVALLHTYLAEVAGALDPAEERRLLEPVAVEGREVCLERLVVRAATPARTVVEVSMFERQGWGVRRFLAGAGRPALHLVHVAVGPVLLGDLPAGQTRPLTDAELEGLRSVVRR